jgi:hypothetical protein
MAAPLLIDAAPDVSNDAPDLNVIDPLETQETLPPGTMESEPLAIDM